MNQKVNKLPSVTDFPEGFTPPQIGYYDPFMSLDTYAVRELGAKEGENQATKSKMLTVNTQNKQLHVITRYMVLCPV